MKKIIVSLLLIGMISPIVSAKTIFSCTVKSGKMVKVDYKENTDIVTYSYGRNLKKPEIVLKIGITKVLGDFRSHYGGMYSNSIGIRNGKYTYVVTNGLGEDGKFSYLSVRKGNNFEEIASFNCKSNQKSSLEEIISLVDTSKNLL